MDTDNRARQLLKAMLGAAAEFRPGQLEVIRETFDNRRRVLLVQKTGWGKSIVYFIVTKLLRERGSGPTLLISPLLSLMRNQLLMAGRIGLRARSVNSTNREEWDDVQRAIEGDVCDVLLVAPERLANQRFHSNVLEVIPKGIGLVVVDEAHCISDWGHDFRPDYRRIVEIVRTLPSNVPVLATTATANDRVVADVVDQIGSGLEAFRGPLIRESLHLQTIELEDQADRMAWLAENVPRLPGSGIIYCLTIADCERVAGWLQREGINARPYHAALDAKARPGLEDQLLDNEVKALVATVALGMGFDKPDLGFVIHFQCPGSVVAYYQQIGRAGRALEHAYVVLLSGREDDEIQDYFIRTAFPGAKEMLLVAEALEASDGLRITEIERRVNLPRRRIQHCLKFMTVEGAVFRDGPLYVRSARPWKPDEERARRVSEQRRREMDRMRQFVRSETCLMEFVARELDDSHARPCGKCAVCAGGFVSDKVSADLVRKAIAYLQRNDRKIAPRKVWPLSGDTQWKGYIPDDLRNEEGRTLCIYGDAGWGRRVIEGKYEAGIFGSDLVGASVDLIRTRWAPAPFPTWVTAVPSKRHPLLVAGFAARLARQLRLPFRAALEKTRDTEEQKVMENSAQQFQNILGSFRAIPGAVLPGPVLLVDDITDSRWTLTYAGAVLREGGSGLVYPFALAYAAKRGD